MTPSHDEEEKEELKNHIAALKERGVKKVHVAFSGGGDEGYINDVVLTPEPTGIDPYNTDELNSVLYDYLDPAHVGDWVNNEGGFGTIEIDVETGKIKGEINFNEITYNTEPLEDQL